MQTTDHTPATTTKALTPSQQEFYSTMADHYDERAAAMPGIALLQQRASEMRTIATNGYKVIELMPDPNDPDVLV